MPLMLAQQRAVRLFWRRVRRGGVGWRARKGLALREAILWCLVILMLVAVHDAPVVAQGCDDCREIKKELRDAALNRSTPVAGAPLTAPVVRVVLYWAEGCGHCHEVLDSILPQMHEKYGPQLEVRLVEVVSLEDIAAFFDVAEGYGFPRGKAAVPFLLIGDRALMGVEQIERDLPGLIETYLAAGGVDWPDPGEKRMVPQPAASAIATSGCDFATPCADGSAASAVAPTTGMTRPFSAPAPILIALGFVAVGGGSLTAFLRQRARRRQIHASTPNTDTSLPANGDNDAT